MEFLECVLEWFQVSFPEKKFKEWWSSQMNRKPLAYDPCPEDFARWGYAEANRNADDAEANGKIIGYDLAVAELKARDAKLREILEDTAWCLREYVEGFQTDGKGKSTLGMAIGNTKKALLLVEEEAKTKNESTICLR